MSARRHDPSGGLAEHRPPPDIYPFEPTPDHLLRQIILTVALQAALAAMATWLLQDHPTTPPKGCSPRYGVALNGTDGIAGGRPCTAYPPKPG